MAWLNRRAPLILPPDRNPRGYRFAMRLLLIALALAGALAGLAPAATITGGDRGERLRGTSKGDLILARGGRDTVDSLAGSDRIAVQYDGARDRVRCGAGQDVVTADQVDVVAADCERVSRLISRDGSGGDGQHETQVEPSAVASAGTIVATFQSGRRHEGGANRIGFSTSRDGGRTWRSGFLPALTNDSVPPATSRLASDPVVAFDAAHRVWLISTLAVGPNTSQLFISRSIDGVNWGQPVVAATFTGSELAFDKNWIACDNWRSSPRRGRCYLSYTDHTARLPGLAVQRSDDGGQTWSPEQVVLRDQEAVGVLPLPRPDGSLVITYLGDGVVQSVRSTDGGLTFEDPATISRYFQRPVRPLRTFPLPTADVDARGRIYVAWQDCSFRPGCPANDIVLARSSDGVTWGAPTRLTRDGGTDFVPALAVDRSNGRLAVVYHRCSRSPCRVDVLVTTSTNGGNSWSSPRLLTAQQMNTAWLPTTTSGRMVGDYIAAAWSLGRAVAVYSLASPPAGGEFRQAIAAARIP
jgi:hypothetical protein